MRTTAKVVIIGGGFAGLETAFALRRHLGDRVELALVADRGDFLFKPNTVYLPFGGDEERLHIALAEPLARRDVDFHRTAIAAVHAERGTVVLANGVELAYDYLVLATGATMRADEIPGLGAHAHSIWTPAGMHALGAALERLRGEVDAGHDRKVLFLVPPGNRWAGPLYETAFILETWLRRRHLREHVRIEFTTAENGYLQDFGDRLNRVVSDRFVDRGITGRRRAVATEVRSDAVAYADGTVRAFDLLIAFPPYAAAAAYPGLPTDGRGFLLTEPGTRRVRGHDRIYAPGDAGDFPVKQGYLAALQADAVADDIAHRIDPAQVPHPRRFDATGVYVIDMLDRAAFAQAPFEVTGDPDAPVRIREDDRGDYRVGVSPMWRLGKKASLAYVSRQFKTGRPLDEGLHWQALDLGLKSMSHALASPPKRRPS